MKSIVGILLGLLLFTSATQAEEYPINPVTLVVPFSPGGGNDMIARFLGDGLAKLWGQPVVVENRPGGGTSIGAAHVARSKPNGYTLLLVSSSYATNAASRSDLPFDPRADLVPIGIVGESDQIVLASPKLNLSSVKELIDLANSRKVFYGIAGFGSNGHFYGAMLAEALGIELEPVSYPGGSEALVDLVGGRIDLVIGAYTTAERPKGVVPLVQLSEKRSSSLSQVQTIVEAGYPNAVAENYWTIFVPAGTPSDIRAVFDRFESMRDSLAG